MQITSTMITIDLFTSETPQNKTVISPLCLLLFFFSKLIVFIINCDVKLGQSIPFKDLINENKMLTMKVIFQTSVIIAILQYVCLLDCVDLVHCWKLIS